MYKANGQQYGVGIESEGFIVNGERGQERIEGISSAEWVRAQIAKKFPRLSENTSFEQASVMLELKTDVFATNEEAIRQIQEIRAQVDRLLAPHGCRLVFEPVLAEPFEFVPATSDPASRTHRLIEEWSKTPEGVQMLYSTAIASYQINDSRPFAETHVTGERMEIARRAHNLYSQNFDQLNGQNVPMADHEGKTRMDRLYHLLTGVKGKQFKAHGYEDVMMALIPPYFADVEAMKRWMRAHSDAPTFEEAKCKNEHAVTIKVKRDPYWAIETRVYDSVDSEADMRRIAEKNEEFLKALSLNP